MGSLDLGLKPGTWGVLDQTVPPHSNPVCCFTQRDVMNRIQDATLTVINQRPRMSPGFHSRLPKNWIHHYDKLNKHKNKNTSQCTIESVAHKPVTTTVPKSKNVSWLFSPRLKPKQCCCLSDHSSQWDFCHFFCCLLDWFIRLIHFRGIIVLETTVFKAVEANCGILDGS